MKVTTVESRCECQARLTALLDERCVALRGTSTAAGVTWSAPAHTLGAGAPVFQVGWACPHCGRNTLRSFHRSALAFREDAGHAA